MDQGNVRTPRINPSDLGSIRVSVPERSRQRAVANFLDAETAHIDAVITRKRKLMEVVAQRFESAVFVAVTRGLHEEPLKPSRLSWVDQIPHSWGTPPVCANFDLQLGKMLNGQSAEGPEQHPYLRNTNVQWGRFSLEDLATMQFDASDRHRCALRAGDLLVCEGGEVGRAAVWPGEPSNCFFQKAVHRVRPRNGANSRFLMYCLRAAAKTNVFAVEGNLSTIIHLTGEQLRAYRFPWPPADEQVDIVEYLDAAAATTGAVTEALTRQIELLQERRQALITAAVTGELDIPAAA